ncbi:MAG TPA: MotA/TolQ/ExbB proton channel family protein [Firmicutes bacterium]|nr:MotA/TolQ/ExbB proton channel family protein [Bacillota bacterium]
MAFLHASGVWGYPLLILSVIALAAILDRFFFHLHLWRKRARFRGMDAALFFKKNHSLKDYPCSGIILDEIKESISSLSIFDYERARGIVAYYQGLSERRMGLLSFAVTAAPLLGILGTISGIISSFRVLGVFTLEKKGLLTAGISEALLTTAAGLIIAIVTLASSAVIRRLQKTLFSPYVSFLRFMRAAVLDEQDPQKRRKRPADTE